MDVRLPDGTIIQGVPDGMSKADLTAKLKANGHDVAGLAPEPSFARGVLDTAVGGLRDVQQFGKNLGAGAVRGAGSIGATLMRPFESGAENTQRRQDMDAALQSRGAETDSLTYAGGKIGAEIAGTAGLGGALAKGVGLVSNAPMATVLANALKSGGMTTGARPAIGPALLGRGADLALRTGAGAAVGGASAGLVNPDDARVGALIGGAAPAVILGAGAAGSAAYNAFKGGKSGAGQLLAKALNVSEAELPAIIQAAQAAPDALVPGSKLTLAQAMKQQGIDQPAVKILERIAAEGPGGNQLLKRYAEQGEARMGALQRQGAQTYQGAAATEAENTGNTLASLLRTQAGDERLAVKAAWEGADGLGGVHGRAVQEGAALQLPLDRMKALVADRMGDGYTGSTAAASKTIGEAERIGTDLLEGLKPIPQSAGKTQSLEQAVRSQGGIQPGKYLNKEITELGRKQSKTTGLVSQYGRDVEAMANTMHERGFLPDNDPATLLQTLRSGGGRRVFADDHLEAGFQRMAESAAGDMPEAERIAKAVPFKSFQALRSSSGRDAARLSEKTGSEVEAGVMTQFEKLMAGRVDDAAMGNLLPGESMSEGLRHDYQAARDLTRQVKERYSGGTIASILRKPAGQNYTLNGNEVTNKLWHGGAGLAGDVATLKQVLSADNQAPAMNQLRQLIMTQAADKTTAGGGFGAALPNYVETRLPGLQEALTPNQLQALTSVAADIRNAEAAASVQGLRGSDTFAKASRAMDAGLLGSPGAKRLASLASFKGIGLEPVRNKLADIVMQNKGKTIAALMADPKAAAAALQDKGFVRSIDAESLQRLRLVVARSAPILAAD